MMRLVPDNKRTEIGPTGPARPATGVSSAVAAVTPAPVTPAPTTDLPAGARTSYLPPQEDPLLGRTLAGRYLIQKKLGEGGMGAVYLATHNLLEKQVALKVLHGEFARKADLVERFMQEARAASRIRHENVIDISDFGTTPEGLVFFAMELLHGHDLHEEVARARLAAQLLPWVRSKRIFLQICAALGAAHALGIIHRDLKPENIYLVDFLGEPDFVKLLDFGIAKLTEVSESDRKLTRTGMLFGTPEYMSPEQARGEAVDHRVDVYAMGCILFQLVTGRVPFEAENFMGVLALHLTETPPVIPPEIFDSISAPRALAEVIDRALAKDRNQRFASIDELARAVRRVSGDKATGPVVAQPSVPAPTTGPMGRVKTQWTGNLSIPEMDASAVPRKSKLPLILGAVLLVGGGAVAAFVATRGSSAGPGPGSAAVGSAAAPTAPAGTPSTPPAAPPSVPTPPAGPPPLAFEWAQVRILSVPAGADVKDLTLGKVIGHTPFSFKLKPSRTARQFELHHKGYIDTVIEVVPDREKIETTEKLERGAGRKEPRPPVGSGGKTEPTPGPTPPTEPGDLKVPLPGDGSGSAAPVKHTTPPGPPGPGDDDCGDPPCLKRDPSRPASGGDTGGAVPPAGNATGSGSGS
jgi:serine/threonine-protein kinase